VTNRKIGMESKKRGPWHKLSLRSFSPAKPLPKLAGGRRSESLHEKRKGTISKTLPVWVYSCFTGWGVGKGKHNKTNGEKKGRGGGMQRANPARITLLHLTYYSSPRRAERSGRRQPLGGKEEKTGSKVV